MKLVTRNIRHTLLLVSIISFSHRCAFFIVITGKKSGNRRKDDQDAEINLSKLIFDETDNGIEFDDTERAMKKNRKIVLRRSSLESGAEAGGGDAGRLRRHKSLDGGDEDNFRQKEIRYKDKDKKDPRMERRIRNKVNNYIKYKNHFYILFV